MKADDKTRLFDSLSPQALEQAVKNWQRPEMPEALKAYLPPETNLHFWESSKVFSEILRSNSKPNKKMRLEVLLIEWLYALIRLNVKRGRIFNLQLVLETGRADCLGYAKLLTVLGRYCGLNMGVVEVLIDNRGENVPHTAVLADSGNRRYQIIDLWYGNADIHHRRLGLRVKGKDGWKVEDVDSRDLKKAEIISYLPDECVEAITFYIEGNRSLKNGAYFEALERYSEALRLYPQDSRIFYNRAIAYEKLDKPEKAMADYRQALVNETATLRTLATQSEDIVSLIRLDENNISEPRQQVYLLRKGFITGKREPITKIASKTGLSEEEVNSTLNSIEKILAKSIE